MKSHVYSTAWYSTFLDTIPAEQTMHELAFIKRQMPLASHPKILDVCCGPGRHSNPLARAGYHVTGVDSNPDAVARARETAPATASYRTADMRHLGELAEVFDGVINLWASFGYFDDRTNEAVARQMAGVLRPGGRALLDLYNRDHMATLPRHGTARRGAQEVKTTRTLLGSRFRVRLEYSSGASDDFDWRVYTPDELSAVCSVAGFDTLLACAWFDEAVPASAEHARMQVVLERRAS